MADPIVAQLALAGKAWPFEESRAALQRYERRGKEGELLLQTGYGPSGLPHIGTFGEVQRTVMVAHAVRVMSGTPTRLLVFSDDLDALRKVPENVPRRELLEEHLGKPLTSVPDPFGTHESFGRHNNERLRRFLDRFGFRYEFRSSTDCYRSGVFDEVLLRVLERHDRIRDLVLPTLGSERRSTYSPILPISPRTGTVLQVSILECRPGDGTVVYLEADGSKVEVPVTGGGCKLQWKADWAMRWAAFDVDYEMAGKDLSESVQLSSAICRELGGEPPAGFSYELFLDEQGNKISKSKGNGLTIEEWLRYAPPESLSLYMFKKPRSAKRLYFDVIPQAVDEYADAASRFPSQSIEQRLANPCWHIHEGEVPAMESSLSYTMLLNLVSASNSSDREVLWGFIRKYQPGASPASHPYLDRLVGYAVCFYEDFVRPTKRYRPPDERERGALEDLLARLSTLDESSDPEAIQTQVYAVGKEHGFENLRAWFQSLYETLLGQSTGPRMGSFIAVFGKKPFLDLVQRALSGELSEQVDPRA